MVLITTCGASSIIIGAICKVKSAGYPVATKVAALGSCRGLGAWQSGGACAKAGRSKSALVAIKVAHPNRKKSLRFMRSLSQLQEHKPKRASQGARSLKKI